YALGGALTTRIQFVGPYTNIQYSPAHYAVIAKLIDIGEIKIKAAPFGSASLMKDLGLESGEAVYHSISNNIYVQEFMDETGGAVLTWLIVHEATHAIQDWLDMD